MVTHPGTACTWSIESGSFCSAAKNEAKDETAADVSINPQHPAVVLERRITSLRQQRTLASSQEADLRLGAH